MAIIRKRLTQLELLPANRRFNETTEQFEYSPDGGTTWYPDEAGDPRTSDIFRLPPLTGGGHECDAAARMVAQFQDVLIIFNNSVNAAQFGTALATLFLLLTPVAAVLAGVFFIVFDAFIDIGQTNIEAAFTPTVWDEIKCIINCNIGEDGQISTEQRDAIMAEIAATQDSIVYNTMVNMVNLFGEVLMSNAAVVRTEEGDCSECSCTCTAIFDFTDNDGGFTSVNYGSPFYSPWTWSAGVGWTQAGGQAEAWLKSPEYPAGITITEIRWTVVVSGSVVANVKVFNNSYTQGFTTGAGEFAKPGGVSDSVNDYLEFISSHSFAANYRITRLEIDWDNCE